MKSLRDMAEPKGDSVLVIGGGPSIAIHNQLETLRDSNYRGIIVACDRMLIPLLKYGIVPQYVVSVDSSPIIVKFFRHKLVKKHLSEITFLIHIATNPLITRYLYRLHANVYWFLAHQVYATEAEEENSDAVTLLGMTSTKWHIKGVQTLPAGGNVGVAAWALSWVILHKKNIALIGFDMGYPEGTPLNKTYYYSTFIGMTQEKCGKNALASLYANFPYEKSYNPKWKSYSYTDQVFRGYRNIFNGFLDAAPTNVQTWSCVEGGTLDHPKDAGLHGEQGWMLNDIPIPTIGLPGDQSVDWKAAPDQRPMGVGGPANSRRMCEERGRPPVRGPVSAQPLASEVPSVEFEITRRMAGAAPAV